MERVKAKNAVDPNGAVFFFGGRDADTSPPNAESAYLIRAASNVVKVFKQEFPRTV